ncbi:MAG: hypothetical protein PHW62_00805 [Candidatus Ratteibacteria bacterium]|nr:hypothetical protein [Candidatus Ratteibacteria bacterium]
MNTITLSGRDVSLKTIERYIIHLQKQNEGSIGDPQEYEWMRARLHNNIFIVAGFNDKNGIPARIIERDTPFGEALSSLVTDVLACPKEGHGTTDRNGFCFHCGKFITKKDSIRTLKRIASEQKKEA